MSAQFNFTNLTISQKFLFAGHIATAVGLLCISVGTTLRWLEMGNLPIGPQFTPAQPYADDKSKDVLTARNYFS